MSNVFKTCSCGEVGVGGTCDQSMQLLGETTFPPLCICQYTRELVMAKAFLAVLL